MGTFPTAAAGKAVGRRGARPRLPETICTTSLCSSFKTVCGSMKHAPPGAQTERRGGAGPVRGLLGGKDRTGRLLATFVRFADILRLLLKDTAALLRADAYRPSDVDKLFAAV